MKSEDEVKEWFFNLYNSCYIVNQNMYPNIDYLCYDEYFNTQCKLKNILGEEIIYPTKPTKNCLFSIHHNAKMFYVDLFIVWRVIELELNYTEVQISKLIKKWLNEHDDLKLLTPICLFRIWDA